MFSKLKQSNDPNRFTNLTSDVVSLVAQLHCIYKRQKKNTSKKFVW